MDLFRKEDPHVSKNTKLKLFFTAHWKGFVSLITPLIFLPIALPNEPHLWTGYTLLVMAVYWVSECIPLAVTAFLPVLIFPLTGVMSTAETCKNYINDSVVMFLGSIMLAFAVEQSGLHKRLAYLVIKTIGYSHIKILLAMCMVTTFVSMWITNTAATTMMVPINFALLKVFEDQNILIIYDKNEDGEKVASDITSCYFCAATFSATIGGIGTLVGTGTNLAFKGLFQTTYPDAPEYLSFPLFSAFGVPYMIAMEACTYMYLIIVYFGFLRPGSAVAKASVITPRAKEAASKVVNEDLKKMGRLTFWEIMVIILFGGAMVLFFCRSPQIFTGWGDKIMHHFDLTDQKFVRDSALAMLVSFLMLLLPSSLILFKNCTAKYQEGFTKGPVNSVLNWKRMNAEMPYSFMFLLGGGFALSSAARSSGLNDKLGGFLQNLKVLPNDCILLIIIIVVIFITNFASNVAVCNVLAPISMTLAQQINKNPLWYCITAGFTASYCFMLPVGTPGNLIVQGAVNMPTNKMIKAGFGPTITTIILSWFFLVFWAPVIWPDLHSVPDWAKPPSKM